MKKDSVKKSHLQQGLICVILGMQYAFIKNLYEHFENESFFVLAVRFLISFVAVGLFCLLRKTKPSLKTSPKEMLAVALYPALSLLFQFCALGRMNTTSISALLALSPVINGAVCAFFPKGKNTKKQYLLLLLCALCGAAFFLVGERAQFSAAGVAFILGSVAARSLSNVIFSSSKKKSPISFAFKQSAFAFVLYFVVSLFAISFERSIELFSLFDANAFWQLLYLGVLSSAGVSLINAFSLDTLSAADVGIYSALTSLLGFLCGVIFMGDSLTLIKGVLFGMIIVLAYLYVKASVREQK